jgi:hypothetical protein
MEAFDLFTPQRLSPYFIHFASATFQRLTIKTHPRVTFTAPFHGKPNLFS